MLLLFFLALVWPNVDAMLGFGTTQAVTPQAMNCLKDSGYEFFVAHLFNNDEIADDIGVANFKLA
jgi:hypothetical protein